MFRFEAYTAHTALRDYQRFLPYLSLSTVGHWRYLPDTGMAWAARIMLLRFPYSGTVGRQCSPFYYNALTSKARKGYVYSRVRLYLWGNWTEQFGTIRLPIVVGFGISG